jgi:deazaflavin-dependent oxidoreductase (nitroreductase family)
VSAADIRANRAQRAVRRFAGSGPGAWVLARVAQRVDEPVYRLTRGRHTLASMATGIPIAMLTTTGARSGQRRSIPVLGLPSSEGLVVIASNFGQGRHPGWYHNLRANPEGEVTVDGETRGFRAVEAEGERRERIWQEAVKVYPGWSQYAQRDSDRRFAVFVLEEPAGAGTRSTANT